MATKKQEVFIYHDEDHGVLRVFRTLAAAQEYGNQEWEEDEEAKWTKASKEPCKDWRRGEYQHIARREVE